MLIQKIIDITEYGAQYDINKYLANGWHITHEGITVIIIEKEVLL